MKTYPKDRKAEVAANTAHAAGDGSDHADVTANTSAIAALDVTTTRGDMVRADASGNPERVALGADNAVMASDGTDAAWETLASLIKAALLTTNGDLLYVNGSGTVTRLGIGSASQVLTVSGGLPAWAAAAGGGGSVADLVNGRIGVNYGSMRARPASSSFDSHGVWGARDSATWFTDSGGSGTLVGKAYGPAIQIASSTSIATMGYHTGSTWEIAQWASTEGVFFFELDMSDNGAADTDFELWFGLSTDSTPRPDAASLAVRWDDTNGWYAHDLTSGGGTTAIDATATTINGNHYTVVIDCRSWTAIKCSVFKDGAQVGSTASVGSLGTNPSGDMVAGFAVENVATFANVTANLYEWGLVYVSPNQGDFIS